MFRLFLFLFTFFINNCLINMKGSVIVKLFNKVFLFISFLFLFSFVQVDAKEKVKVYVFEAGGCPFCELQVEYLEGLNSYGEKFDVIRKELYVDHIDWEIGKDFEIGSKVVELFNHSGFEYVTVYGTPLVIISDIYASNGYNTELESFINEAYEEGDRDIVSCVLNSGDNCLPRIIGENKEEQKEDEIVVPKNNDNEDNESITLSKSSNKEENQDNNLIILVITISCIVFFLILIILLIRKRSANNEVENIIESNFDNEKE